MKTLLASLIFSTFAIPSAFAQEAPDLDTASQDALVKTQQLLNDQSARDKAVSTDPKAIQADEFTKKLTGGDAKLSNDIYSLAAEVFSMVVKDANGDPNKMKEAIEKFSRDPASFANKWTPEQKAKLNKLSQELPQALVK